MSSYNELTSDDDYNTGVYNVSADDAVIFTELFPGYPTALLRFAAFCCIMFMIVGVLGNLITVTALYKYKKVRNATTVFIMNLSTSDLMFCCFNLPFAASLFWKRAWTHGALLCRLLPLMRYGLLAVSLFSVLAITINRYVMIGHPRLYPKIYKQKYLACMLALMWLSAFGALIATWFGKWGQFGLDVDIGSCSIIPDKNGHSPKQFLFIIAFVIPCIFILVCYARIFYIVRKTALKSRLAPRNNTVVLANNLSSTQKDDTNKSEQNKIKKNNFQSPEDSAIGTLSTTATITDKSSSVATERIHYLNEGTSSFLLYEPGPNINESTTINDGLTFVKTNADKLLNNNEQMKARSNPNLLTLPEKKLKSNSNNNKINNRSLSVEHLKNTNSICDIRKETLDNNLDKSFSLNQIHSKVDEVQPISTEISDTTKVKDCRCSSMPFVSIFHCHRKFNAKLHLSSLTQLPMTGKSLRHTNTATSTIHSQPGKMTAKDKKILKMILVIFLSFIICYLPITISKAYTLINSKVFNIMGYILIYLTPCINPLIYVVMSSEYRQAYKNLLMCKSYGGDGSGRST